VIDILVQRNIAGHRRGEVVRVHSDDPRYAAHLSAGNVIELAPAVDDVADAVLSDAPAPTGSPWIHPDEDYDDAPLHDSGDEDLED